METSHSKLAYKRKPTPPVGLIPYPITTFTREEMRGQQQNWGLDDLENEHTALKLHYVTDSTQSWHRQFAAFIASVQFIPTYDCRTYCCSESRPTFELNLQITMHSCFSLQKVSYPHRPIPATQPEVSNVKKGPDRKSR